MLVLICNLEYIVQKLRVGSVHILVMCGLIKIITKADEF